ncbi:MAG TPA: M3 family metallopeptidase [Candidatus Eisenbacteria bacterium]|nr:M3 family metallopeptidase [Candidatus Eisenbacteria bacterium]
MTNYVNAGRLLVCLTLLAAATISADGQSTPYGPHVWDKPVDPAKFEKRIDEQLDMTQKAVDQLVAVKGRRTIENTLAPYDEAVQHLDTAYYQSGLMQIVNPDAAIRDRAQAMVQKVSAAATELALNQKLYKALAAMDVSKADPATKYYVQRTLLEFRLAGVDKDDATRARIKTLNDEITKYSSQFQRNLQESQLKVVVKDPKELDGLPEDYINSHKPAADGTITLTSDSPDVTPVLKFAKSADLRKRIYLAYNNRAYPQNVAVLADLLKKRQELATVLGYKHWADVNAADKMAGNSQNIAEFIGEIDNASKSPAEREYKLLLAAAQKQDPSLQQIGMQDRSYYFEQLRRSQFDFNSQAARPYFPYDRVQAGILEVASKLFHVTFKAVPDAPVWDPSVSTFDVYDGSQKLGRIYLDMHPRPGKDQWFSSNQILDGIKGKQLPEAALVCNFSGGKPGEPGLMEYGEVTTFFHEFGHLMHWIFQGQQQWAGYGNNLEADFVEAPSQMLEEWMHDPKVLATFALHYQTNQPIPAELVMRANRADAFGRGIWARFQLVYTSVSFDLHNMPPQEAKLEQVVSENIKRFLPYTPLDGDNQIASFTHLTGYSSAYYTYLWDKVIAEDFFSQFNRNDLLAPEVALRYRSTVLEKTGSMPANDLVKSFLGRPQALDAFKGWMNQEFQALPPSGQPSGQ